MPIYRILNIDMSRAAQISISLSEQSAAEWLVVKRFFDAKPHTAGTVISPDTSSRAPNAFINPFTHQTVKLQHRYLIDHEGEIYRLLSPIGAGSFATSVKLGETEDGELWAIKESDILDSQKKSAQTVKLLSPLMYSPQKKHSQKILNTH